MVTIKEFFDFVDDTNYRYPQDYREKQIWAHPDTPVRWVSQNDAIAYCEHVGMRLPTNQEFNDNTIPLSFLWEWVSEVGELRGGSWDYYSRNVYCAYRSDTHPAFRFNFIGFRCLAKFDSEKTPE